MGVKEKNIKMQMQIIEEILDCNKNAQNFFSIASKVDKGKSEPNLKKALQKEYI